MQQTTVAYRLGWFLYWVCLLALIALYWVFWINTMGEPWWQDWRVWLALVVPAFMLYGLGRGLRYVLSGELHHLRRFPAPWKVEALEGGFKIVDANGQSLAYVYGTPIRVMPKSPRR